MPESCGNKNFGGLYFECFCSEAKKQILLSFCPSRGPHLGAMLAISEGLRVLATGPAGGTRKHRCVWRGLCGKSVTSLCNFYV
jgi:hypothetical protein